MSARADKQRGQAMVELALILPLFVMMILFSLYLTELVRAKLKLQEATRFTAWEMTSHPLDDTGSGAHAAAAELARQSVISDAVTRYADLDSAENLRPRGPFVGLASFDADLLTDDAPVPGQGLSLEGTGESSVSSVLGGFAGKSSTWVLRQTDFNLGGWVHARASVEVLNRILPRTYLQSTESGFFEVDPQGDRDLNVLLLRHQLSMVASDWHLSDGADAVMGSGRAGRHVGEQTGQHGLHRQVGRMVTLGFEIPTIVKKVGEWLPIPQQGAAYVVSRNYKALDADTDEKCAHLQSYPPAAGHGLNNLWTHPSLDADSAMCFDTAPFRDTQVYDESLYLQMFEARGNFFMGCQNAQADDSTTPVDVSVGDQSPKIHCVGRSR